MSVYYNEIDKQKAQWIRELMKAGVIAQGEVDERSITEVQPQDLEGFTQCHFFAGIAAWSYALRLAGWPDDRFIWTGSCPCPSFSAAGKGQGFRDARHLWPDWARLILECNPAVIFGEQVESAIGHGWLDLVQTDLENADYAVGKAVLGACSVGAPHRRQRLYFVAHSTAARRTEAREHGQQPQDSLFGELADTEVIGSWTGLRDSESNGERRIQSADDSQLGDTAQGRLGMHGSTPGNAGHAALTDETSSMGDTKRKRLEGHAGDGNHSHESGWFRAHEARSAAAPSLTGGFWSDAVWLYCRDGKYRPTGPGIFPLAHRASHRVAKLRGIGDAIVPQVAAEFIQAFLETEE